LEELFIKLESNNNSYDLQNMKDMININIDQIDMTNNLVQSLDHVFGKTVINESSAWRQIFNIARIRIKVFGRNLTFVLLYNLIPICIIISCIYFDNNKYIDKLYNIKRKYNPLEITPTLYKDVNWFKNSNTSNGIALDIINNIDSNKIKMDTINYDHQLIIEINQLNDTVKFIERFSSHQDINNNQALNFIIYYNNLYTYTIPIAINLISNAYLKENGVDKFLSTSFKPFPSYSEFDFGENDKEKIVNTYPEKMRSDYDLILAKIIAFIFFKLFFIFFF